MIVFYNPQWSYYVHHYYNHPYIYSLPYSSKLVYNSHPMVSAQKEITGNAEIPKDYADLLSVFIANNLGNLATSTSTSTSNSTSTSVRYPPYSSLRFRYYQDR